MLACYTPLLGTHEWTCRDCGTIVELPNGCNNRHCCTCGGARRRRWAENTCSQILPIEYGHLIFTLPQPLTQLAMINQRELYSLLLREGASTLLDGGRELLGVELCSCRCRIVGANWCCVTSIPTTSFRWVASARMRWSGWTLSHQHLKQLLAYVRRELPPRFCQCGARSMTKTGCSSTATRKLAHLQSPSEFERWLDPWENRSWIVRCGDSWDRRKADFGPDATMKVVGYLANYVGRIALSDSRILDIQGDHVLFQDYRDHNQLKAEWIEGVELIHRFLQHLLPPHFRHIRCYGWMAPRVKPEKRAFIRQYHGLNDPEPEAPEPDAECDASLVDKEEEEEEERTQTCRFCRGQVTLTGTTLRPKLWEVMELPLRRFLLCRSRSPDHAGREAPAARGRAHRRRIGTRPGEEVPGDPPTAHCPDFLRVPCDAQEVTCVTSA